MDFSSHLRIFLKFYGHEALLSDVAYGSLVFFRGWGVSLVRIFVGFFSFFFSNIRKFIKGKITRCVFNRVTSLTPRFISTLIGWFWIDDVKIAKACVVFWLHHQCFSISCWGKTWLFAERSFTEITTFQDQKELQEWIATQLKG